MARSIAELSNILRDTWEGAEAGDKVASLHMFGVAYSDDLKEYKVKELREVAATAGLSPNYGTELRKMVGLSKFVKVKRKYLTPMGA